MRDPVLLMSGITYEREAITRWFDSRASGEPLTCPATGQQVPRTLIPVFLLREQYDAVRLARPELGLVAREPTVAATPDAVEPQAAPAAVVPARARSEAALRGPAPSRAQAQNAPLRPPEISPFLRLLQEASTSDRYLLPLAVDRLHHIDDATRFLRELTEDPNYWESRNPDGLSRLEWAHDLGVHMIASAEIRGDSRAEEMWRRAVELVIPAPPPSPQLSAYRRLLEQAENAGTNVQKLAIRRLDRIDDATAFLRDYVEDDSFRATFGPDQMSPPSGVQLLRNSMLNWIARTATGDHEEMWLRALEEVIPASPPA